ncbi:response regulator transcription factor [Pseudobdellovibrio exovorus]|uniref:Chemotaxis response regulator n=1 Tax=Pseudobdellovibrio exovorus JSS TaxID=1184267 RepID=M4VDN3_9BACT|nr:response regulator [Pseudobdellovibrio exovorus]AGH96595.1 chemotaxis response regulator [Pseudobdellovibrio exovorus JSS]
MSIKCLVVEEAAFIRQIYRLNLHGVNGVEIVAEARDGVEALRLISEIQPDMVLLELVLPLKSGLDVLKSLHGVSPRTQVIVISSLDDESLRVQAKALGAHAYLTKPFTRSQLLGAVEEICQHYAGVQNG